MVCISQLIFSYFSKVFRYPMVPFVQLKCILLHKSIVLGMDSMESLGWSQWLKLQLEGRRKLYCKLTFLSQLLMTTLTKRPRLLQQSWRRFSKLSKRTMKVYILPGWGLTRQLVIKVPNLSIHFGVLEKNMWTYLVTYFQRQGRAKVAVIRYVDVQYA